MTLCVEIDEVKKLSKGHFFSRDTMRAFNSRVSEIAWPFQGGYLFWTSEKCDGFPRYYSVRYMSDAGNIRTIGEFQGYSTAVRAANVIKTILARGEFPHQLKGFA